MMDAETAVMPSQAKNIRNADKHQKLGEASKTSLLCDNLEGWDRAGGGGDAMFIYMRIYKLSFVALKNYSVYLFAVHSISSLQHQMK